MAENRTRRIFFFAFLEKFRETRKREEASLVNIDPNKRGLPLVRCDFAF